MHRRQSLASYAIALALPAACGFASEDYQSLREQMVAAEIQAAGVTDLRVLKSMRSTPRHEFVPAGFRQYAYLDMALPIGDEQTISPPFVVATMTQELDPQPDDRVLEIGTGSGYQAAVLSPLVKEVYTIEIVERLGRRAERTLRRLGYQNVHVRTGDGYLGWPEAAPFDKIIVTCSPEKIPAPLIEQLREGGRMIIPVGERYQQNLFRVTKRNGKLEQQALRATLFVPMTGTAESDRQVLPDPARPQIVNGSFEQVIPGSEGDGTLPTGWHYLRRAKVVRDQADAPDGERYLSLSNTKAGQPSRALQGMAIDGRQVRIVRISAMVRGERLAAGLTAEQRPGLLISFYDQRRAVIENQWVETWTGTFPWRSVSVDLRVPKASREAIVRLGVLGGMGHLEIDGLILKVVDRSRIESP